MSDELLERVVAGLNPERTVLLFGAGAARSSGAPISLELCRHLEERFANSEHISDELAELGSILEHRTSRRTIIEAIIERLRDLKPDGALQALAKYPWPSIYSTNYDLLVERAYAESKEPLAVVRSHFDWDNSHTPGVTTLFKLHGCISQDRAFGHAASMIVTLQDYEATGKYRNLLFDRLKMELAGNTVLIIGHSLRDQNIVNLVREALRLQKESAAPGQIHLLVHQIDEDRAAIWRSQGIRNVIEADLNKFVHTIASSPSTVRASATPKKHDAFKLPHRLQACTIDISNTAGQSNPRILFFGAAATLRWSRFVGQVGGSVKVYSAA